MTLECYRCRDNGFPGTQIDYDKATKKTFEPGTDTPHTHKGKVGAASATTTNTSYRGKDSSARDESIKKMQEQKQAHELKLMESAEKNAQLLAESNKAIAEAINGLAITMHKLSESTYALSQATRLEHSSKNKKEDK